MPHPTQPPNSLPRNAFFSQPHQVKRDELDFLGHVNNKQYLTWMETLAWAHANAVGINEATQNACNRILIVHEHTMRFHKECLPNNSLILKTWLGQQLGACRRQRHFAFVRTRDDQTVFTATTVYVCIDRLTHRPKPIPNEFIQPYQATGP
ncbi:thioesterase family protein [Thiomicrospira sp. WB1]|uniref:acyl-CoA thioesterase n=1 Tax=Thiomicrospira sp. WB1 TaxID=1685380 RepID=UPI00074968F1|nr:thioesterase family protein [Thiomicrospira sp. WB1]KUJ71901.1 4-hydroxybenzoyl-CoA thioesterase [Thiomicrospira sp. WB1]